MSVHSIKIIDNKRILLTNDEWKFYKSLCKAYETDNQRGEEFFKEHFETNKHGILTFVRPPHKRYSSLEIYTFLVSIMINQHLRLMQSQVDTLIKEATKKYGEIVEQVTQSAKLAETPPHKEK